MKNYLKATFLTIVLSVVSIETVIAQVSDAPPNVAAALAMKLAGLEKRIGGQAQDITIYVMGDVEMAAELAKGIGKNIGTATLKSVEKGDGLPNSTPQIIFIGKGAETEAAIAYARENNILSITRSIDDVNLGITLGVGIGDGKPKILLNLSASVEENCDWNPAIMKIAQTIK